MESKTCSLEIKLMKKRIIARLDIKGDNLIKSINLEGLKKIGKPQTFAKKYYKENIGSNLINFINKKSKKKVQGSKKIYSLADKSLITVSTASSFGLENLARGNRSVIFNNKINITKKVIDLFWNYKFKQKGAFWSNESSFSEVKRLLGLNLKKNKNHLNVKRIRKILMTYDNRNNTFRKIIKNLI